MCSETDRRRLRVRTAGVGRGTRLFDAERVPLRDRRAVHFSGRGEGFGSGDLLKPSVTCCHWWDGVGLRIAAGGGRFSTIIGCHWSFAGRFGCLRRHGGIHCVVPREGL